jgi:hypothetical protein
MIGMGNRVDRRQGGWPATAWICAFLGIGLVRAEENVYLTGVPDYRWHGGCYGTCTGNLIGYWDRHGFPDFYTGPTADGVAPLNDYGANQGIYSLWTSKAGRDGRPADQPGHEDDYYIDYQSTADDPCVTAGRPEHEPDCIGDFIGLNQKKWSNMGGECDGNIDGYSFVYWNRKGFRENNFQPSENAGLPAIDVQSGLRAWAAHQGYHADTFTQLAEFNPEVTAPATGFTYDDVKAEIDAGYPLIAHLQRKDNFHRALGDMERANPEIHAVLIYGYYVTGDKQYARIRTSWGTGDNVLAEWRDTAWLGLSMQVRGVVGFHPRPQIISSERNGNQLTLRWIGPDAEVYDQTTGARHRAHWYVVERASILAPDQFEAVSDPTTDREWTGTDCCPGNVFYRIKQVPAPE